MIIDSTMDNSKKTACVSAEALIYASRVILEALTDKNGVLLVCAPCFTFDDVKQKPMESFTHTKVGYHVEHNNFLLADDAAIRMTELARLLAHKFQHMLPA